MKELLVDLLQLAGGLLRERFGREHAVRRKESPSSIVTEVDLAAERLLVDRIRREHPGHNILAEESGFEDHGSEQTWVIDPLDGTSNYAAGLPWFGVMIALLHRDRPVFAGMYLPVDDLLYLGEDGKGVTRNGVPVRVTDAAGLEDVLFAYGADASEDEEQRRFQSVLYGRVLDRVRNVRATNSMLDFAAVIDGRLGGVINHATRIWDIAAPWLLLREAGGRMTDLRGEEIVFRLSGDVCSRNHAVLGASERLHGQMLEVLISDPLV